MACEEGPTPQFVQCVLAAACILIAGAALAFAGMFASTRCGLEKEGAPEAKAGTGAPASPRHGRGL